MPPDPDNLNADCFTVKSGTPDDPQTPEMDVVASTSRIINTETPMPQTSARPTSATSTVPVGPVPQSTTSTRPTVPVPQSSTSATSVSIESDNSDSLQSANVDIDDISVVAKRAKSELNDKVRKSVLTNYFSPVPSWKGPKREIGQSSRRVPAIVFKKESYPYASYSTIEDALYCAACVSFSKEDSILVSKPLVDWSNAKKILDAHCTSSSHRTAVTLAREFMKVCNEHQVSVRQQLSKAYNDKIERNKSVLSSIIKTIILCGQQNIPIRGHTDTDGNFGALLRFRCETDHLLQEHLLHGPKNANYISHAIQNELIDICGQQIAADIVKECQESNYFTLLADESADVSNTEQISVCLRYVHYDREAAHHIVKEQFLCFIPTRDTTGETIAGLIKDKLSAVGLGSCTMVGQGYDGAANMSGHTRGVQARMKEGFPEAVYVHCRSHNLNLAICDTCKLPLVRNMYTVAGKVLNFIRSSPKRLQVYLEQANATRLKRFSPTRWTYHTQSIHILLQNFSTILATLQELKTDADVNTRSDAVSLSVTLDGFEFIVTMIMVEAPMQHLVGLCDFLQKEQCDLVKASSMAQTVINVMSENRNSDAYFATLWNKAWGEAERLDISITKPRTTTKQMHRSNAEAGTPEEYWKINLFLPFIDHLIMQLQDRLTTPLPRLLAEYLLPSNISNLTDISWTTIKEEYNSLLPASICIDTELINWKRAVHDKALPGNADLAATLDEAHHLFPNIYIILKTLLTMPVSTATAERSFSTLKRLKTYLRNTMGNDRLTALALMNIHKERVFNVEAILKQFDASGHRRIAMVFTA